MQSTDESACLPSLGPSASRNHEREPPTNACGVPGILCRQRALESVKLPPRSPSRCCRMTQPSWQYHHYHSPICRCHHRGTLSLLDSKSQQEAPSIIVVVPLRIDRFLVNSAATRRFVARLTDAVGSIQFARARPIRFCPEQVLPLPPDSRLPVISPLRSGERLLLL